MDEWRHLLKSIADLVRYSDKPLPPEPTGKLLQTQLVEVYRQRHEQGYGLYHPDDAIQTPMAFNDLVREYEIAGNYRWRDTAIRNERPDFDGSDLVE